MNVMCVQNVVSAPARGTTKTPRAVTRAAAPAEFRMVLLSTVGSGTLGQPGTRCQSPTPAAARRGPSGREWTDGPRTPPRRAGRGAAGLEGGGQGRGVHERVLRPAPPRPRRAVRGRQGPGRRAGGGP